MSIDHKIVIVGGGLSGLTLAYLFTKENIPHLVLEGASRLGGRIQTINGKLGTPMELGATWFADKHEGLTAFLDELEISKHPQFSEGVSLFQTKSFEPPQEFYVPESEEPSYRIAGGTQMVIESLKKKIAETDIELDQQVVAISEKRNRLFLETRKGEQFRTEKVILCLPPQLVGTRIKFSPQLPEVLTQLLPTVQTWMTGSIKFVLEYDRPFWRDKGYSGMLYSHSGIVMEMYDHTNAELDKFGFTGFLNGAAASYSPEIRKEFVLKQLQELLGEEALGPVVYEDKVWIDEFVSGGNQVIHRPHQNNGHPLLRESYFDERLYFSGTETSAEFPGYMEGAICSAQNTFQKVLNDLLKSK